MWQGQDVPQMNKLYCLKNQEWMHNSYEEGKIVSS